MSEPGYYKMNPSALSLGELVGMRGLLRLPLTYLVTRSLPHQAVGWLPLLWTDVKCQKADLSERFWHATSFERQELERLGFTECCFSKNKQSLNPLSRDNGCITYWDKSHSHIGQLLYSRIHVRPPIDADREEVVVGFISAFTRGSLSYSNAKGWFDRLPQHKVVRKASATPSCLYRNFQKALKNHEQPLTFPNQDAFHSWQDVFALETFENQVRRKLYIRMSDKEVERARSKMTQIHPE